MFSGNFIFIFAELERLRSFQFCLFTQGVAKVSGRSRFYCLCRFGLSGENAFGAARVCVAMKAPVGLLSGERSASADGGALPRQVPQAATNAKKKNLDSAEHSQSESGGYLKSKKGYSPSLKISIPRFLPVENSLRICYDKNQQCSCRNVEK